MAEVRQRLSRTTVVLVTCLLVLSVATPYLAIDTAQAATSGATPIDDFEDGDIEIEDSAYNWNNLTSAGQNLTLTEDAINGSYSTQLNASNQLSSAMYNGSVRSPSRIGFRIRIDSRSGNSNDRSSVRFRNGGTHVGGVAFLDNGNIAIDNGSMEVIGEWQTGQVYRVDLANIDYTNDQYDIFVNGEKLATDVAFKNSVSGFDNVLLQRDTGSSGEAHSMTLDDFQEDGETFEGSPDIAGENIDDFEDGNTTVTAENWTGWTETTPDSGGTYSFTNDAGITGQSGRLMTDGESVKMVAEYTEFGNLQSKNISGSLLVSSETSANTDETSLAIQKSGTELFKVRFEDSSRNVIVHHGGAKTQLPFQWELGETYDISYKNINWASGSFDLEINDTTYGTYSFDSTYNGYDQIALHAESEDANETRVSYFDNIRQNGTLATPALSVTGKVVSNDGTPVPNATVEIWAVNTAKINTSGAETLSERSKELLEKAEDVTPPDWDPDKSLTGSGGLFQSVEAEYVAAHTSGDWGLTAFSDAPELGEPRGTVKTMPADQPVILSVWDASAGGGMFSVQDGVDADLRGRVVDNTDIVIESVGPGGDTIDRRVVKTSSTYDSADYSFASDHDFAKVYLDAGFYRIYPKGQEQNSYIIAVGNPESITQAIREDLRNRANTLTDRAKNIRENLNNNTFQRTRVVTNETGHFAASTGTNVEVIAITAYKGPLDLIDKEPQNVSLTDIRTLYQTVNTSSSVYLSTRPTKVEVPKQNVQVEVREVTGSPYMNMSKYGQLQGRLQDLLDKFDFQNATSMLQQRLENLSDERTQRLYERLAKLSKQNDRLQQRVTTILRNRTGNDDPTVYINESSSNEEMRERIRALQQAMQDLEENIESGDPTADVGQDSVSLSFPFGSDLNPDQVAVLVHYSNGTTQTLGTSSQYVSVKQRVGRGDVVQVNEFPLGNSSAPVANFEVRVANSEGIGQSEKSVKNPTFNGEVPGLRALEFSTLRPGPDETVTMSLHPKSVSKFGDLKNVVVYSPSGNELNATITDSRSAQFTTNGKGVYYVEAVFTNPGGKKFTTTARIVAGETDIEMPATLRVKSGVLGTYAIVGDGLNGGEVNVESGGAQATIVAQVAADGNMPQALHVYTKESSLAPDNSIDVRVVKGEEEQAINANVRTVIHTERLPESALTYRNGKPMPYGESQYGLIQNKGGSTVIKTYTDDDGTVSISTNANPGFIERAMYAVETSIPNFNFNLPEVQVGSLGMMMPMADVASAASAGGLLVFIPAFGVRRWFK